MRRGLLIGIAGLVLLNLGVIVLTSRQRAEPASSHPDAPTVDTPHIAQPAPPPAAFPHAAARNEGKAAADITSTNPPGGSAEKGQTAIEARIAQLEELSTQNDASALEVLLSELKNPEQEIRHAALEAITQMGNRDAIPRLLELATQTDQPDEKRAITEAVEFLKLPTLTESMRQETPRNR